MTCLLGLFNTLYVEAAVNGLFGTLLSALESFYRTQWLVWICCVRNVTVQMSTRLLMSMKVGFQRVCIYACTAKVFGGHLKFVFLKHVA